MRCAIIGLACIFPGAGNADHFWRNIVGGVDSITEVPEDRWDKRFFDPHATDVDKFYCKRGGFIDEHADFDPLPFGIMPNVVDSIEPDQLLTLKIGYEALRDAGYADRDFPRARAGVIIGSGNYVGAGVLRLEQHVRLLPQLAQSLTDLFPDLPQGAIDTAKARLRTKLSYYGPDVAAGMIPNLLASRLANRLDLHGPAYTIDAACASSLIAVEQACALLAHGETDMMFVGGAHLSHDLTFWATFCQLGALSRSGVSRPFSAHADGILAGEGVGMAVLKRLDDALADGDRIYAVIEGAGSASDGRGASLVAPSSAGQTLALEKAWQKAGLSPGSIGLLEAHGTGTQTGDAVELATVRDFFAAHVGEDARPVLGSVKSMIGHAMPASGMASLIKAALAVYHGVRPPSLHCDTPHPLLRDTGFRVLGKAEAWPRKLDERIAAVNAFGFGGINAHLVLRGVESPPSGLVACALPPMLMLAGETPASLLAQLEGGAPYPAPGRGACRLAITSPDETKLTAARKAVISGKSWTGRQQIWFSPGGLLAAGGKLAFVFPGVGAEFRPRVDGLAAFFGKQPPAGCVAAEPDQKLAKTVLGLLGLNRYLFDRLADLGVRPDGFAGHSVGEWSAMLCAGMIDQQLADRTTANIDLDAVTFPDALFIAAACSAERLMENMAGLQETALSHDNCPHQSIACGPRAEVEALAARLRAAGIFNQIMNFVSGFHAPLFAGHMDAFRALFAEADMAEPEIPVWSATIAAKFPSALAEKQQLALAHLLRPVQFRALIESMYADGFRVFVEVGAGTLCGFINDTLAGRPHLAVPTQRVDQGGLAHMQQVCAALWAEGGEFDMRLLTGGVRPGSASTRKLKLGVGLVHIDTPLEAVLMPARLPAAANENDQVGTLILETLADIERAGREVLELWQLHRARAPAAPRISTRVTRLLDIESTASYLRDHEFYRLPPGWPIVEDRRPVVPMTMEIMLVREAVQAQVPGMKIVEISAVQAYKWLDVSTPVTIEIMLESRPDGVVEAEITGYFKARVTLAPAYPAADIAEPAALIKPRATEADARSLYDDRWMFHGPDYQGVAALNAIGDNGIDATLLVTAGKGALLDNMGQVAGYWVMEQPEDCLAMPIGVGRIRFFADDPMVGDAMREQMRVVRLDDLNCVSDHVLRDAGGRLCVAIEGWHTRRYRIGRNFWLALRRPGRCPVSQAVPGNVMIFEDNYDTAIVRDHIARSYLTKTERDQYDAMAPRRRRHWLSGRVAAKDAVLAYLRTNQGGETYPQEIVIENDAAGAPYLRANVSHNDFADLSVSISHKDSFAAAIVGSGRVGIDIERIEPREESFLALVFSPAERGLLVADDPATGFARLWVAKEVVAKQARTGLAGRPLDFVIQARDGDCFCVNGSWVVTHTLRDYIVGWSLGVTMPKTTESPRKIS
jgi:3-oxoacyl-(acyl-carrier-protein) synthase/phosphopantetheinyl transferase